MSRKKKGQKGKSRLFKTVVIVLIIGVILLGGIVGLLFTSPVQTSIANYFLEKEGGAESGVTKVHITPSSALIEGVTYIHDGIRIELGELQAKGDWLAMARGAAISLDDVAIRRVTIDARNMESLLTPKTETTQPEEKPTEKFDGILKQLGELPVFSLSRADIEEVVILLPDDISARLDLTATGFGPGKTGTLTLKADTTLTESETIPLSRLQADVDAKLSTRSNGTISAIETTLALRPTSSLVAGGTSVNIMAKLTEVSTGEAYETNIRLLDEEGQSTSIASINALYERAAEHLRGGFTLNATRGQLAAVLDTAHIPDFSANSNATFIYSLQSGPPQGELKGKLALRLEELERLSPQLDYLGTVSTDATFDLVVRNTTSRINDLQITVAEGNRPPLLLARLIKPFTVDVMNQDSINRLSGDLFSFSLNDLPISLIAPLVPDVTLGGDRISALMTLSAEGGALRLTPVEPIIANNLSVQINEEELLKDVDVLLSPHVSLAGQLITADIQDMRLTNQDRPLLEGRTQLTYNLETEEFTAEGNLASLLSSLTEQPFASQFGQVEDRSIGFSTYVKMAGTTNAITIDALQTRLTSSTQRLVMIDTLRPFTLTADLEPEDFLNYEGELVKIAINRLPPHIIAPYIPGYNFSGDHISGGMTVAGDGQTLTLRTDHRLRIQNATITEGERPLIDRLTVELAPFVSFDGKRLRLATGEITLSHENQSVGIIDNTELILEYEGDRFIPAEVEASISSLNLPLLYQQPILGGENNNLLQAGTLFGEVKARITPSLAADAEIGIRDIRLQGAASQVNRLNLVLQATQPAQDRYALNSNLTLNSPQGDTKARFNGEYAMGNEQQTVSGTLSSERLVLPDLLALVPAGSEASTTPQTTTPASTAPDTEPVWAGIGGSLVVDIKTLVVNPGLIVDGLRTEVMIEENRIAITDFTGSVNQTPLKLGGEILFDPSTPQTPYRINNGEVELVGFNVGSYFTTANPSVTRPVFESILSFDGNFSGSAPNLGVLADYLDFDIKMSGTEGVIRPLESLGSAGTIANIAGGILGRGQEQNTLNRVLELLSEIRFIDLRADLLREGGADILINALEFIGSNIKLAGAGKIERREGTSLADSPINLPMTIHTRGSTSELFNRVRLLEAGPDADGWATGPTFVQRGPLADSRNNLRQLVVNAAGRNLLDAPRINLSGEETQAPAAESTPQQSAPATEETKPRDPKDQLRDDAIRGVFDLLNRRQN